LICDEDADGRAKVTTDEERVLQTEERSGCVGSWVGLASSVHVDGDYSLL